MVRPRCCCKISHYSNIESFKPTGVSVKNKNKIVLSPEELEALRLKDVKGMEQMDAAKKMGTSQSTFQRILASARKKTSTALVQGVVLKLSGD